MNAMPDNLKYAATHEWALLDDERSIKVGITDFAQSELGDIVFIGLPEVGRVVVAGEAIAVIESVKTASDLHAPVTGAITAINEAVQDEPERINDDAFGTWLFCITADDPGQLEQLMDAAAYQETIEA